VGYRSRRLVSIHGDHTLLVHPYASVLPPSFRRPA
jgi:hypothetical protein